MAERFRGVPGHPLERGFDFLLVPEKLDQPLHWRRPRKTFVNAMSDLFHEDVPVDYIALLRGELRWMTDLDHVAFGVSVEDRRYGIPRIRSLQDAPARIRFLSVEPLLAGLGPLDSSEIDWVILGGESGPHARPMLRNYPRCEWSPADKRLSTSCSTSRTPTTAAT